MLVLYSKVLLVPVLERCPINHPGSKFNVLMRMYIRKVSVSHAYILSCNSYANFLLKKFYEPLASLQELLKINRSPVEHIFYYFSRHFFLVQYCLGFRSCIHEVYKNLKQQFFLVLFLPFYEK